MRRRFRSTFLVVLLLVGVASMNSGCRRFGPFGKQDEISPTFPGALPTPPAGPRMGIPTSRPSEETWQPLGAPVQPRRGALQLTGQRWQGVVYFAFDSSAIGESERPKLEALAEFLKAHPELTVLVEGNCDERGSEEYNRALGERRALAVKDYLVSLGISPDRIETISYGEERPVIPHAKTEAEHQKNRRAEFVFGVRPGR